MSAALRRSSGGWGAAALAAFVALSPLPFFLWGYSVWHGMLGDEGVVLNGAWRLLQGQLPHRDFYSILPPGAYAVLAAVQALAGVSLVVARSLAWANYLAVLLLVWALARRAGVSRLWVAVSLPIFLLFYAVSWNMVSHHWLACAWVLLSAWLLAVGEGDGRWCLWGAGAAAAAAGLTLQDLGLYWTAAAALALALGPGPARWRRPAQFLGGTAAVGFPVMGLLVALTGLGPVLQDLVLGPLTRYHTGYLNSEAFGEKLFLAWRAMGPEYASSSGVQALLVAIHGSCRGLGEVVLAAAFVAAPAVLAFWLLCRREAWRPYPLPVLAALWAAMTGALLHHPAGAAFYWAMPASVLLALVGLERATAPWGRRARSAAAALLGLPALVAAAVFLGHWAARGGGAEHVTLPGATLAPAGASERASLELADRFVQEMARPGQRVFCYEYNPALYPFLRIPNTYRYDLLILPMLSGDQQETFWRELEASPPHWILWDRQRVGKDDPVFGWMEQRYAPVAVAPHLVVLGPKGAATPPPAGAVP